MMEHPTSPHQLTQFAPLESDSKPQGNFFTRIFKRNASEPDNVGRQMRETVSQVRQHSISQAPERSSIRESSASPIRRVTSSQQDLTSVQQHGNIAKETAGVRKEKASDESELKTELTRETRTLPGVLRRLGNILERRGQTPQAYRDSDFKQYWMPDQHCKQCYDCGDRFTTFRRRHHCRICGQIFCSRCCNQEVPGKIMGYTGYLRVCTYCCKIVLRFAQDIGVSESEDIQTNIQQHLAVSDPDTLAAGAQSRDQIAWASPGGSRRRLSKLSSAFEEEQGRVGYLRSTSISDLDLRSTQSVYNPFDVTPQSEYSTFEIIEDERKALLQDSAQLRDLWVLLQHPEDGLELQSHRYRLRTYHNCLIGNELVEWLLKKDKATNREQAKLIGQALVDAEFLECITYQDQVFRDEYSLLRPGQAAMREDDPEVTSPQDTEDTADPQWIRDIEGDNPDLKSDLNKIPSTLTPKLNHRAKPQSVFYLDPKHIDTEGKSEASGSPYLKSRKLDKTMSSAASVTSDKASFFDYLQKQDQRSATCSPLAANHSSQINVYQYEEKDYVVLGHPGTEVPTHRTSVTPELPAPLTKDFARQDSVVAGLLSQVRPGSSASPSDRLDMNMEPQLGWLSAENRDKLREENGERLAYERLWKAHQEHMTQLTRQLLNKECVSAKWLDVILAVTNEISQLVKPDVRYAGDNSDIRQYVQVKKIAGESRNHTEIISGVVCSKNTAHKKMRRVIHNPKILLLRAPIEYQRVENKFSSLEPQILQEREYLKNCIGRLAAVEPDIVLVEKTVSRLAQEFTLDTNITLVTNVKSTVMERVARMTQAVILNSVDGLTSRSSLGSCQMFRIQNYTLPDGKQKNLMYFDGCNSQLGCTVTLRGAANKELKKVKSIILFMTYVAYHLRLEFSYLMDAFAMPPCHPDENILQLPDSSASPDDPTSESEEQRVESEETKYVNAQIEELYRQQSLGDNKGDLDSPPQTVSDNSGTLLDVSDITIMSENGTALDDSSYSDQHSVSKNSIEPEHSVFDSSEHSGIVFEVKPDSNKTTLFQDTFVGSKFEVAESSLISDSSKCEPPVINILDPSGEIKYPESTEDSKQDSNTHTAMMDELAESQKANSNTSGSASQNQSLMRIKSDSKINAQKSAERTSVEVSDFSDPLHNYQLNQDDSIFHAEPLQLTEEKRAPSHNFKKVLNDVILSISPYLRHEIPYLETDIGSKCKLRCFLPKQIFFSSHFDDCFIPVLRKNKQKLSCADDSEISRDKQLTNEAHVFQTAELTLPLTSGSLQTLLADFRARGGRLASSHLSRMNQSVSATSQDVCCDSHEELLERQKDCFITMNHQRSSVLFSSFRYVAQAYCVNPWVVTMDFYGRNDITLGGFLERFCFRESYRCPNDACETPLVDHLRRFVHENGCVSVVLKKLEQPFPNYQNSILMWGWCRKCKQVTPVIPMSPETWTLSFAKYLELRFHGSQYGRRASPEPCPHNIHHDHFQYFGYRQIVASFKYTSISLREIALPPLAVTLKHPAVDVIKLKDSSKMLNYTGTTVYGAVIESILKLQTDQQYETQLDMLNDYELQLQKEKDMFRRKIEASEQMIEDLSTEKSRDVQSSLLFVISDHEIEIKQLISNTVNRWNERFEKLLSASRKSRTQQTAQKVSKSTAGGSATVDGTAGADATNTTLPPSTVPAAVCEQTETESGLHVNTDERDTGKVSDEDGLLSTDASHFESPKVEWYTPSDTDPVSTETDGQGQTCEMGQGQINGIPKTASCSKIEDSSTSAFFKTESCAELADKQLEKKETKSTGMKQIISSLLYATDHVHIQMPFSVKEHYLLPPCECVPVVVYDEEPSSIIAYTLSSSRYHTFLEDLKSQTEKESTSQSGKRTQTSGVASEGGSHGVGDSDNKKGGSKVLSFQKISEPADSSAKRGKLYGGSVKYTPRLDRDGVDDSNGEDAEQQMSSSAKEKAAPEVKPKEQDLNLHIELQFQDDSARFFCRVYYAEQFTQLRNIVFPEGEERYIRSLSRCFTWLARGGKSGSKFCKTQDDRLILKQMSRPEIQSFREFAMQYFSYMTSCHQQKKPTALAKILGVYRIGFKNSNTNDALKQDVLVMENLFYDRKISQIFDLKGSVRNRLVNTYGKAVEELVLLDENLLNVMVDQPLHVREHSKTVLTMAITNDTHFLSSHLVMDYSLLVGMDEKNKELVVGIIDYIRTFTWDKKVENVVKSTILNSQGKQPTVLSPELYRSRFLDAMDKYFLMVPDRWRGLAASS